MPPDHGRPARWERVARHSPQGGPPRRTGDAAGKDQSGVWREGENQEDAIKARALTFPSSTKKKDLQSKDREQSWKNEPRKHQETRQGTRVFKGRNILD